MKDEARRALGPDGAPAAMAAERGRGLLAAFKRHQVGSLVATAVDFATMSALVSGAGLPAAVATALGAAVGGVTNFSLGRHWIFRANDDRLSPQLARYALVSGASLFLNAAGEYLLSDVLAVQYFAARVVVAAVVSVLWNFPVQRHYVYGAPGRSRRAPTSRPPVTT